MRRTLLASLLSFLAVIPGLARVAGPERERPPRRDADVVFETDDPRLPGTRPGSPGTLDPLFSQQQATGLCEPDFQVEISSLFVNEPSGTWVVFSGDCSGIPGCGHFFYFLCNPGDLVQASFCSHGGGAAWNTNLAMFDGSDLHLCEDDSCGLQSEIVATATGSVLNRLRIGATDGMGGPYDVAVNIPTTCLLGPPVAVDLQEFRVE